MNPPPKMRLAYVVKYYYPMPRISGILRFVYDLVGTLAKDFHLRVFTYRYHPDSPSREEHSGYEIARLGRPFPLKAGRAARAFRPDAIIFGSGFWRPYLLWPYWELFRLGLGNFQKPVILTQYTHMTRNWSFFLGRLLPPPSRVIATTRELQNLWEKYYPEKVRYIPPGVGEPWKSDEPVRPLPKRRGVRIGYFGHLEFHKGPDRLLEAFQEIDPEDAELLINGEGKMAARLREKARGWENIIIQGYVPLVEPWLHSCDLVVLPYRSGVSVLGYSRAALEALVAGIPVVTTPNPAVAPLISEGENGFICHNGEELKARIKALIEDEQLRKRLSQNARRTGSRFHIGAIAGEYKKLIKEIIKAESASGATSGNMET